MRRLCSSITASSHLDVSKYKVVSSESRETCRHRKVNFGGSFSCPAVACSTFFARVKSTKSFKRKQNPSPRRIRHMLKMSGSSDGSRRRSSVSSIGDPEKMVSMEITHSAAAGLDTPSKESAGLPFRISRRGFLRELWAEAVEVAGDATEVLRGRLSFAWVRKFAVSNGEISSENNVCHTLETWKTQVRRRSNHHVTSNRCKPIIRARHMSSIPAKKGLARKEADALGEIGPPLDSSANPSHIFACCRRKHIELKMKLWILSLVQTRFPQPVVNPARFPSLRTFPIFPPPKMTRGPPARAVHVLGARVRPRGDGRPVPRHAAARVPARVQGIPLPKPELPVGARNAARRADTG